MGAPHSPHRFFALKPGNVLDTPSPAGACGAPPPLGNLAGKPSA